MIATESADRTTADALVVTEVTAIPICVPRKEAMISTGGTVSASEFGLVRLATDAGIVGWARFR